MDDPRLSPVELEIARRVKRLPLDHAAMAVMSNIWRTAKAFELRMERGVLRDHGLTFAGFNTLFIVWIWAPVEPREIARLSGVTRATVSSTVGRLERDGLVSRSRHPEDRRLVLVDLTPAGRDLIEALFPTFNEEESAIASVLTAREQEKLTATLRRMQAVIGGARGDWPEVA